jgi:hypothetical protein
MRLGSLQPLTLFWLRTSQANLAGMMNWSHIGQKERGFVQPRPLDWDELEAIISRLADKKGFWTEGVIVTLIESYTR